MESTTQQENQPVEEKNKLMEGLKSIGFAIIMFVVAYYFYSTMTSYENGESIRMNRLLLIAYKLLGKTVSTVILALLGIFGLIMGGKEIIDSRKG